MNATYDVLSWAYDGSTDPNDHLIWARRIPVLSSLIRVGTGRKGFAGGFCSNRYRLGELLVIHPTITIHVTTAAVY